MTTYFNVNRLKMFKTFFIDYNIFYGMRDCLNYKYYTNFIIKTQKIINIK